MFRFRKEGEPFKNGFNFYRPEDMWNIGFVFRWITKYRRVYIFWCRYSKITKKCHVQIDRFYMSVFDGTDGLWPIKKEFL